MRKLIFVIILVQFSLAATAQFVPSEIALQPKKQQLMLMVTDAVEGLPDSQFYWTGVPLNEVLSQTGTGLQLLGYSALTNGFDLKLSQNGGQYQFLGGDNITITPVGNKFYFSAQINSFPWADLTGKPTSFPSSWATTAGIPTDILDGDANTTYTADNGTEIIIGGKIQLKLDGLSTETSPVLGDYIPLFDVSQNTENKMTLTTLKALIGGDTYTGSNGVVKIGNDFQLHLDDLSTETSPVLGDYIPLFDVSQNTENKMTLTTLKALIGGDTYTGSNGVVKIGNDFQLHLDDLSTETSPVLGDYIPLFDVSQNTENKMTLTTLKNLIDTDTDTQLTTEQVQDAVGAMFSGNTETGISVVYSDNTNKINFSVTGGGGSNDGNGLFSSGGTAAGTLNMNSNSITNFGSISSTTFGGILTTQYTIVPSLNNLEIRLTGNKKYIFNNTGAPTADDHVATKKYVDDNAGGGGGGGGINYTTTEQDIGQSWVDGKTIFQKTINVGTITSNASSSNNIGVEIDKLIDLRLRARIFSVQYSGGNFLKVENNSNNYSIYARLETSTTDRVTVYNKSLDSATDVYVTIQYTK